MSKKKPAKDDPEDHIDNPMGFDEPDPGLPTAGEAPVPASSAAASARDTFIDEDLRAKFRLIYELETRALKGHGLDPDREVMLRAAQELRVLYGLPADQKLDPTGAFASE